jgi:two-component system osmolarity sensor histidine kinase EnvZ
METAWLKAYAPRSLMGRAALILLLPIVTIQLVVGVVFIQRHYENVTRQMTQNLLLDLNLIVGAIDDAGTRDAAMEALEPLAGPLRIDVTFREGPEQDSFTWYDVSGRVLIETLRSGLPALQGVDLTTNPRRVIFGLETGAGPATVDFDRRRVVARNPHQLLVLMIFVSLILTVISFLFLKNQVRPITRLATAAGAFGRGRSIDYRPSGATEVRAAGNAFLDMRNRIERHIEQRTLMLSGVSHDLRTPLTRLKLGLSMMEDDPEVRALLKDVDDMESMIDTFLGFARTDALDDPVPVRPAAFAAEAVQDARRSGGEVTLDCDPDDRREVALRPMAVRRALDNLIGNALRYGSRAAVEVSLTDRWLRLTVEDDGPGIPEAERGNAIKPFARLDEARNQNRGTGVGLGLAIAADVARQHGGSLRLSDSKALGGLRVDLMLAR